MDTFRMFSGLHAAALVAVFGVTALQSGLRVTARCRLCRLRPSAPAASPTSQHRWGAAAGRLFQGFALSTQALITPSLTEGPAIYPFWFFWSTHGIIVGVALYEVFARGPWPERLAIIAAPVAAVMALLLPWRLRRRAPQHVLQ